MLTPQQRYEKKYPRAKDPLAREINQVMDELREIKSHLADRNGNVIQEGCSYSAKQMIESALLAAHINYVEGDVKECKRNIQEAVQIAVEYKIIVPGLGNLLGSEVVEPVARPSDTVFMVEGVNGNGAKLITQDAAAAMQHLLAGKLVFVGQSKSGTPTVVGGWHRLMVIGG